jgi:hypothetical protein
MSHNIVLGILLTLLSIIICSSSLYPNHVVYAHNFSITDDSALLTFVEQIKAETELVNTYFLASNNSSAIEHAKNVVNRLFNDKLSVQASVNEKVTIDNLEQSIKDLKYAIDNKIRAEALMEIVHMKIHPMLQSAYDLKLVVR